MKAYRLHALTGPDSIRREDLPSPVPGHGQVLVRIRAVSLNYRDLMIARGEYNPRLMLPRIPLSDGSGEVAGTGAGVTRVQPGDRVMCSFMPDWIGGGLDEAKAHSALGGNVDGVLAEEVVLPAEALVRIPEYLSFEEAATLPCAAVTAWHALVVGGAVKPGDTVLTLGSGGVSIFALQFARLAGAKVIATSSSDQKLERLKDMGAAVLIDYKTVPEWHKVVREQTGGVGVDQVVEVGGAGTLPRSLRAVRMGGYIALIGVLTGAGEVDPTPILMRNIRVQGIFVGSRSMFESMTQAIAANQLRPVIDRVFEFDDVIAALKYMESGSHFGKVVIRI